MDIQPLWQICDKTVGALYTNLLCTIQKQGQTDAVADQIVDVRLHLRGNWNPHIQHHKRGDSLASQGVIDADARALGHLGMVADDLSAQKKRGWYFRKRIL